MVMAVDWFAHVPKSRIPEFLAGVVRRVPGGSPVVLIDQLPGAHSYTGVHDKAGNHLQERALKDGTKFRVIKHFFTDVELQQWFEPHTSELTIERFPECRRILVHGVTKRT